MRTALLLVDLQEDFLSATDLTPPRGELVARTAALLKGFRAAGRPVIHVWTTIRPGSDEMMPHWRSHGMPRCVEGTPGHATPLELRPVELESVVHKVVFSPLATGDLVTLLRNLRIDTVVLAGVHLHACIRVAALDAYQHGFRVRIAEDAVGTYDALHGTVSRRYLEGRAARFLPVDPILASLDGEEPRPLEVLEAARDAVTVAARARPSWAALALGERLEALENLAACVEGDSDVLSRAMATDVGKPVRDGRDEVEFGVALVRAAARFAASAHAVPEGMRRRPLGVVAAVTPWNNPVGIPLGKIAPALAYGNAVVWKPAPEGTAVARRLLDHLHRAGVPEGLVSLVEGNRAAAEALMEDPGIDAVTLTGSPAAGMVGQVVCARRHIPFQGELGGNNAAIVWDDTDLDVAAESLAIAGFGSAGQRCTANRRIIVSDGVHDVFVERLEAATAALTWGTPLDEETRIGPLVSMEACDRVAGIVARARETGAVVRMPHPGSQRDRLASLGAYHPPTIVTGVGSDDEIVQEETFGPVVVVQRARTWDEAILRLNGVRQGLVAALFTRSPEREASFLAEARAGILKIGVGTAGVSPDAPFSGWKASGVGSPEHGPCDRDFYTRVQAVSR